MKLYLDFKKAIGIAMLFFMAFFILMRPVMADDSEQVITAFEECVPLDMIEVPKDNRPALEEILKRMPDRLKVRLNDDKDFTEIAVSWNAVGDDYEKTDNYYIQFSPSFDESLYSVDESLNIVKDAPYVAVLFYDESTHSSDELSVMSTTDNEKEVYSFCVNKIGINSAAACGVLANIRAESNFNPEALGDSGTSYGLCQWHGSRWDRLKSYCSNNDYDSSTIEGQMYYLKYELNNYYKEVLESLKKVSNDKSGAYDAGYVFCYEFERPSNRETQSESRGNYAKNTYWSKYGNSSDTGDEVSDDTDAPETIVSENEITAKENNEPYSIKKVMAKKVGDNTVWLYAAEEIPYRGFKSKSAADYGVTLSINGVHVPSANIALKVKGKSGSGNSFDVYVKKVKGSEYKKIFKKLKSSFKNNSWTAKQYSFTVSGDSIKKKNQAVKNGQVLVKLKKDGASIGRALAMIFYHSPKGVKKKKAVKIKKAEYSYDTVSGTLTFSGNFKGSVSVN